MLNTLANFVLTSSEQKILNFQCVIFERDVVLFRISVILF